MTIAFISNSDCGRHDTGLGPSRARRPAARHPASAARRPRAVRARRARRVAPRDADELALAHDPRYVAQCEKIAAEGGGRLDADTVASEGSWDAATAGAGAVLDAIDLAFGDGPRRSFCAVRPPGHHALRDDAMGFCLFGNVAHRRALRARASTAPSAC